MRVIKGFIDKRRKDSYWDMRKGEPNTYLAIDIGASGGRHFAGQIEDSRLILHEVYRFDNAMIERGGRLCWDIPLLFSHVINGLKACSAAGFTPKSVGVDTWGVDFVLLDSNDRVIGDAVAYRDPRTNGMDSEVERVISSGALYQRTGIQKSLFNTIYQLMAVKKQNPEYLERAKTLLMLPDYINFLLTGEKCAEYTNASTTALLDVGKKDWDFELIGMLGLPERIFPHIEKPGTSLGGFCDKVREQTGFSCEVILPATHDTASAFMAVPASGEDSVYLSSGTWSLMGVELTRPLLSEAGMLANFTNEGGYEGRYRYLKNIMGLWLIQSIRRELNAGYSYGALADLAREGEAFCETVDVNDHEFMAPDSMTDAVHRVLSRDNKKLPASLGETLHCVYNSLAESYAGSVKDLRVITRRDFTTVNVVGGGSRDSYLNELTAKVTGLRVLAGPSEATAVGNLSAQMIAGGEFANLLEARRAISDSFEPGIFEPG